MQYKIKQDKTLNNVLRTHDEKAFWNLIKNNNKSTHTDITVDEWYKYFYNLFNTRTCNQVYVYDEGLCEDSEILDKPINEHEVDEAINKLKLNKSPGIDGINSNFITNAKPFLIKTLTTLFNHMYEKSIFPPEWNRTVIIPIHKKGNKQKPENYRGISLTPTISKIFTHILNKRLVLWAESSNIIVEEQSGFRKSRSTVDNIFIFNTVITKYLKRSRGRLYCVYVDFEKAYDRINRDALWVKLCNLHISKKMLYMLQALYSNIKNCVNTEYGLTNMFDSPLGLKQGCVISPILFTCFINDIIKEVGGTNNCITINSYDLRLLLYADDMIIISDTPFHLQQMLNKLNEYCNRWSLNVNIDKTKITVFRNGGYLKKNESWKYDNRPLEIVSCYKYLGVHITSRGIWTECQKSKADQANKVLFSLKTIFKQFYNLQPNILMKIFDSKILPILHYGSEVWGFHEGKNVDLVHTKYCKFILGVNKSVPNIAVLGELGRANLITLRYTNIIRYWLKLVQMN